MKNIKNIKNLKNIKINKDVVELFQVLGLVVFLLFISLVDVYNIIKNYVDIDSILAGNLDKKIVYVLERDEKHLKYLQKHIKHFQVKSIKATAVLSTSEIKKDSILLVLDANHMDKKIKNVVQEYIARGGSVIFNFADKDLVNNITNLDVKHRILIPKGEYILQAPLLANIQTKKDKVDIYEQIYTYNNQKSALDLTKNYNAYGVLWYGDFKKGRWVYSSLPFDILKKENILNDIVDYIYYGVKVEKFPYLDVEKPVIINEYLYYKFDYNVINLINEIHLKATLFVNPKTIKDKIIIPSNIEIATNSLEEKEIKKLSEFTNQKIVGFSNENVDITRPMIVGLYKDFNLLYVINKKCLNNHIYYDKFVDFSQDGFNDMSLIGDVAKINEIIDFKTKYGLFVFTIHSYILGYKENLPVLEQVLRHLQIYDVITAREARHKYIVSSKIYYSVDIINNGLMIKVKNASLENVKNLTFRVYSEKKFKKVESNLLGIKAQIINKQDNYFDIRIPYIRRNAEFFLRVTE